MAAAARVAVACSATSVETCEADGLYILILAPLLRQTLGSATDQAAWAGGHLTHRVGIAKDDTHMTSKLPQHVAHKYI